MYRYQWQKNLFHRQEGWQKMQEAHEEVQMCTQIKSLDICTSVTRQLSPIKLFSTE